MLRLRVSVAAKRIGTMRRIMLFTWVGFAALSAGLFGFAIALDYPKWPATQCQAKWADAKLATRWMWDDWCEVYANGAWVPDNSSAPQFKASHTAK
jgi:hypothetical protein